MDSEDRTPTGDFVSTGRLPEPEEVERWLGEARERFARVADGRCSDVYPALAEMPPELFGISVVSAAGRVHRAGEHEHPFTIMSVSKPFVFALVCSQLGSSRAHDLIGANPTGLPFNSKEAVERGKGITNPMVNPGAIVATSLVTGDRWPAIHAALSAFAGRKLTLDEDVLACALESNHRNRELAGALAAYDRLGCDPDEAVELYTRQCALSVTATDLAVMGATLADGGVNPITGEQVVGADVCHAVLAVMVTAGMYETSGDWLFRVGLPAKSGIGGGIVTVSPGKGGMGTFSPPLDAAGNSVRGMLATAYLSAKLGLDLLVSAPAVSSRP
ncbi:MAG: glutaminase A [Baekduia sp.]